MKPESPKLVNNSKPSKLQICYVGNPDMRDMHSRQQGISYYTNITHFSKIYWFKRPVTILRGVR